MLTIISLCVHLTCQAYVHDDDGEHFPYAMRLRAVARFALYCLVTMPRVLVVLISAHIALRCRYYHHQWKYIACA
jgi:hypothetical protein